MPASWVAAGGALLGGLSAYNGSKKSGTTTSTQQQELDPRMQAYLYGDGTDANKGILSSVTGIANQPQSLAQSQFGNGVNSYLYNYGASNMIDSAKAAQRLQNTDLAPPQMYAGNAVNGARMDAAKINAPGQNSLDLTGAYDKVINGDAGANPYLTGALKSAVDLTNTSYQNNQDSLTNNLQRNVLPGLRSSAVLTGQYGGSRQGIAEGNAISDYTKQLTGANLALGQSNSANTTGAQAQAFNQGQDRSLSALTSLSGQQYATAGQDAQFRQQAGSQISSQAQQAALHNSDLQQATNQNNLQAQLGTNSLNSTNHATGVGLQSGLLGQAYNYGQANDNYGANKVQQAAGILAPFTGAGAGMSSSSPYYTNPGGNIIGGATAGLGLYNAYRNATNGGGGNSLQNWSASQSGYFDPSYVGP